MATTTIKMGKRGTIVLPAKLRKQFGLEDGSLLITEAKDGGISLRTAIAYEVEVYTPERRAELLLNNAMTKEEWDEIVVLVRQDGLDPQNIPFVDPNQREKLPTRQQWQDSIENAHLPELRQKLSA